MYPDSMKKVQLSHWMQGTLHMVHMAQRLQMLDSTVQFDRSDHAICKVGDGKERWCMQDVQSSSPSI
jgi:hypothetical protein